MRMVRVVRASKYRHVHGEPAKVDKYYSGMKLSISGDGNGIKANRTFFAAPVVGGGGPVIVAPLSKTGRESAWATLNVHRTPVLDVDFNPFIENMIATGADDGTICVSMFPEKGIEKEQSEAAASLDGASVADHTWILLRDGSNKRAHTSMAHVSQVTRRRSPSCTGTPLPTTFWRPRHMTTPSKFGTWPPPRGLIHSTCQTTFNRLSGTATVACSAQRARTSTRSEYHLPSVMFSFSFAIS